MYNRQKHRKQNLKCLVKRKECLNSEQKDNKYSYENSHVNCPIEISVKKKEGYKTPNTLDKDKTFSKIKITDFSLEVREIEKNKKKDFNNANSVKNCKTYSNLKLSDNVFSIIQNGISTKNFTNVKEEITPNYGKNSIKNIDKYNSPKIYKNHSNLEIRSCFNLSGKGISKTFCAPKNLSFMSYQKQYQDISNNFMDCLGKIPIAVPMIPQIGFNFFPLGIINNNFNKKSNKNYFLNNNFFVLEQNNIDSNIISQFKIYENSYPQNISNIDNSCSNKENTSTSDSSDNKNQVNIKNNIEILESSDTINKSRNKSPMIYDNKKENTSILEVNIKISESENLVFKLRRYDDMFQTVTIFCEINKLNPKFIASFIIYIIKAMNSIYGIYNLKLTKDEVNKLKDIKKELFSNSCKTI